MNDDHLEQLQADVYGILANTPSLALARVILDNKGDLEGEIENELATINDASGKAGLAVIVLAVEVEDAEENLPGPPLKVRVDVQCIEWVELNRDAAAGTLIRSSTAATRVLAALQHMALGGHALYFGKKPLIPLKMRKGYVAHLVSARTTLNGPLVARTAAVEVSIAEEEGYLIITGDLTTNGVDAAVFPPLPTFGTLNGKPYYEATVGDLSYVALWTTFPTPRMVLAITGLEDDVAWDSPENVANPSLVTTWSPVAPATGIPSVALGSVSVITLTCATAGASIYYTTDGRFPSPDSGTLYAAPFVAPAAGTFVRACAYSADGPGDLLEFEITV